MKPNMRPNKPADYNWLVKVIILGDSGVGKSNILTQYCEGKFNGNYMATIGVDFKIKTVQAGDKKIKLQIWDTAGQERFRNITQTYYKGAYGIIYAYSITDKNTFQNIETWIKSIRDNMTEEVCQIIVGNKCDLEKDRQVSYSQGEELALKHGFQFVETSALNGTNISLVFDKLGMQLKTKLENEETQKNEEANLQQRQQVNPPPVKLSVVEAQQPTDQKKCNC